jgi:hypothetical protein
MARGVFVAARGGVVRGVLQFFPAARDKIKHFCFFLIV